VSIIIDTIICVLVIICIKSLPWDRLFSEAYIICIVKIYTKTANA